MLRWISRALTTSVGRKIVMGLTGLLLTAFLVEHLIGNFKLYEGDGEPFDEYVAYLKGFGPLLTLAELGLFLLFAAHIVIALKLTLENREARRTGYVMRNGHGAKTAASVSMHVTGALLLAYLIKHMLDFRFNEEFHAAPAATVGESLAQPLTGGIYIAASVVVGVHLCHGFRSAFQSVGVSHPKLDPLLDKLGIGLAALFAIGFASFPLYFLFFRGE